MSLGSEIMEEYYQREVIPKYKNLISLYEEYINFLNEENSKVFSIANVHGYSCPKEIFEKGEDYRNKIKEHKDKL